MKLGTKIKSVLLAAAIAVQSLAGISFCGTVAYADTTNANGSITKTADAQISYCSGTHATSCTGSWSIQDSNYEYCSDCGSTVYWERNATCNTCGGWASSYFQEKCSCGKYTYSGSHSLGATANQGHKQIYVPPCNHGYSDSHPVTNGYKNAAYGYNGGSPTFIVWPITVVNKNNITSSISVTGCTATDAAMAGKTVNITPSGVATGTPLKVINTGTGETKTITAGSTYTFTMPAAVTTITIGLPTENATTSANVTSLNKTYLDAAFDASSYFTTNSNGAKTYSSSDTTVATVSGSTVTIKKAGSCTITMNTAATDAYYASSASFILNVAKATPTLSGISATAITYGQTLANSTVLGTAKVGSTTVAGRFSYNAPSTVPTVANSNATAYDVTFTPNDTTNFNNVSSTVKLTVNKAGGYIISATATPLTYGQTLSASTITGQFSKTVAGTFAWDAPSTKPTAGTRNYNWTFTPSDTTNYAVQTGTASVTIGKATPTVSVTGIAVITYGQTLSNATVTGSASYGGVNVPGTFSWQNGTTTKPYVTDSNATAYTLIFTPNDSTNYNSVTLQKKVTVNKAVPITNPSAIVLSATPITYGQTLDASTITGIPASDVPGRYVFNNSTYAPTVAESGNSFAVTFIPTDTVNYNNITGLSCSIVVNKATPEITDPIKATIRASEITYGQSLADSTITGDTPVVGYYTWANPAIRPSVSDSNVTLYDVVFNPTDTINYNTTTFKTTLTVNPATPIITEEMKRSITATGITYGDSLAASTLSGITPVAGGYVWTDNTIRPAVADSDTTPYAVTFVPADTVNYTTVTGLSTTVHVDKATPIVTDDMILTISATAITYGETLANSTLSGDTPVAGSYAWVNPATAPTVADSNTTPYDVIFNPDDTANYNPVTGLSCKLTVIPATPVITDDIKNSVSATDITYGDTLAASILTGNLPSLNGVTINGNYTWADDTIQPSVSDSNTTPYTVIFNPTDTVNFTTASLTTTLTVHPKTPVITDAMKQSISASAIVYEQTLADSTLTGDVPVAGHYSWDEPTTMPSVADSDITPYPLTFIPDDNINYTTVSGLSTTLTVTKLAPPITQDIIDTLTAEGITYGDTLGDSDISGDTPRPGHWEWNDPTTTPAVSDSETTEYVIKFVPNDTDNYDPSYTTLKLKVNKCTPNITNIVVSASDITYGDTLANSILTGALPQLNGSDILGNYVWEDAAIAPDAGTKTYNIVFKPTDTDNFEEAISTADVFVNKATPIITDDIRQSITATGIIYEQTLADSTLSGDVPVAGHYEWTDATIRPTVADSNVTAYPVVFIPDSSNYNTVDLSCTLTVSKKAFTFTQADRDALTTETLTYGETLGMSAITGPVPVRGRYHWLDESIVPPVVGDNNYPAEFIPEDTANYEIVPIGDLHVNVVKADPIMTPAQIEAITTTPLVYTQTLANSTIYGEASVSGSFAWVDDSIMPSVADSEVTLYDVLFTPDDTNNYNTLLVAATVKVHKAIPSVPVDIEDKLSTTAIVYGQTLSASTITYTGNGILDGAFTWTDPDIKPEMSDSDNTRYAVTYTPMDTVNYECLSYTATVHVDKAPVPAELGDMSDTVSVKVGDTLVYNFSRLDSIEELKIKSFELTDKAGIMTGAPVTSERSITCQIKDDNALYGSEASIKFVMESRDYLDFEYVLNIKANNCKHNGKSHIENREAATCYSYGYTGDRVCDICDCIIEFGELIEKRPHRPKTINEKAATCTSTGYSGDTVCRICDARMGYGYVTPMIDHIEGEPVVVIPATESTTGLQRYYCIMCDKLMRSEVIPCLPQHQHEFEDEYCYDDDKHWHKCKLCDAVADIDEHEWDEGELITATCTTWGTVQYTCEICGMQKIVEEVPGHLLADYDYSSKEHYRACKRCGTHFDVHTHVYGEWSEVTAPTDEELGEYEHACVVCAYIERCYASQPPVDPVDPSDPSDDPTDPIDPTDPTDPSDSSTDEPTDPNDDPAGADDIPADVPKGDDEDGAGETGDDKENPNTGVAGLITTPIAASAILLVARKRKRKDNDVK